MDKLRTRIRLYPPLWLIGILLLVLWFSLRRPYTLTIRIADENVTVRENIQSLLVEQPLVDSRYSLATIDIIHDQDGLFFLPFIPTTLSATSHGNTTMGSMNLSWPLFVQEVRRQFSVFRTPFTSKNIDEDMGMRYTGAFSLPEASDAIELHLKTINPKEIRIQLTDATGSHAMTLWVRPKTHHDGAIEIDGKPYDFIAPVNRHAAFYFTIILSFFARTLLATTILWILCRIAAGKTHPVRARRMKAYPVPRVAVWLAGGAAALYALWIAIFVLEGIPHTQDEVAYLFQARNFAGGTLYASSFPPPIHRFFDHEFIINNGKWFGKYPPLHSLFLAIGDAFSFPALMNPLLAIGNSALLYAIARRILVPMHALIATALFLFSPFSLLMHASFFSHPLALFLTLTGILATTIVHRTPARTLFWIAVGLSIGLQFLTRPANAAAMILCIAPVLIAKLPGHLRRAGLCAAAVLVCLGIDAAYNTALTGNPLQSPRQLYSMYDTLGFGERGAENWSGGLFTVGDALANTVINMQSLLHMAYLWPPVFTLAFLPFAWMGTMRRYSLWITWCACVHIGIYFFYFHEGAFYGPRYWFEISWACALLTVVGIETLHRRYHTLMPWICCLGLVLYGSVSTVFVLPKFRGTNEMHQVNIPELSQPALVFIDGQGSWQTYGQFFHRMRDPYRDPVIFVRDHAISNVSDDQPPVSNDLLQQFFPNRSWYRYEYEDDSYTPLSHDTQ